MTIELESSSAERIPVDWTTPADPTGAFPAFVLATSSDLSGAVWVNGTWDTTYTNGQATALTPLIGDGQALDVTGGVDYYLYGRCTVGVETPVRLIDVIRVR